MNVVSDKSVVTYTVKHLGLVGADHERGKLVGRMERPQALPSALSMGILSVSKWVPGLVRIRSSELLTAWLRHHVENFSCISVMSHC
jgi:hypothetical protein